MEASALQAPAGLGRARISVGAPLLRLRSDDQLVALFRAGSDDAFRVIHDRYRQRLFAYTRQMLPGCSQDAEDALQDVFVRAYSGLRVNRRQLALKPWLYRVAHNRCVDELRRPLPPPLEVMHQAGVVTADPVVQVEKRESLQRLIADLRRLPDHQRSALLMRELGGMSYTEVAAAMDVSVPAVKSLLVRARIGLALAIAARDTACIEIRDEITLAHDRGVRSSGNVRRHLADCENCREFRGELRGSRRQFAALVPAIGPVGVFAKMLGIGGGGAAGGGAAATGGATATTGAAVGGGAAASASVGTLAAGATHVATLIAAAVVTAGGAVAIQSTVVTAVHRHVHHAHVAALQSPPSAFVASPSQSSDYQSAAPASQTAVSPPAAKPSATASNGGAQSKSTDPVPVSGGDNLIPTASPPSSATNSTGAASAGTLPTAGASTPTSTSAGTGTGVGSNATGETGTGATTGTAGSPGATSSTATGGSTGAASTAGASSTAAGGTTGSTSSSAGSDATASAGSSSSTGATGAGAGNDATTASTGATTGATNPAGTGQPTGT